MKASTKTYKQCLYLSLITYYLLLISCSNNNVSIDNSLQKYFDEKKVTGTFGLYDNGTGQFTIYNLSRFKDSAYLPAETFRIVNALVGLETGKIVNEKMPIKWDGIINRYPNGDTVKGLNSDMTAEQAFKANAQFYYREVARIIGKDTMQHWLDSLKYGSKKINTQIDSFWLDNSLKITADEEMGMVKKLYFNQLPFQKRTQDIVKKMMEQKSTANYKLSYITGEGVLENGKQLGWVVGWIEENRHPYFFALNIEGDHNTQLAPALVDLLKSILTQQAFFEGKR
jgi:beta-lactamase class D